MIPAIECVLCDCITKLSCFEQMYKRLLVWRWLFDHVFQLFCKDHSIYSRIHCNDTQHNLDAYNICLSVSCCCARPWILKGQCPSLYLYRVFFVFESTHGIPGSLYILSKNCSMKSSFSIFTK